MLKKLYTTVSNGNCMAIERMCEAYGRGCTGQKCQREYCNGLHRRAVLPRLFGHLRRRFGYLDVEQIVTATLLRNLLVGLRQLDVESVVSLLDEVENLVRVSACLQEYFGTLAYRFRLVFNPSGDDV